MVYLAKCEQDFEEELNLVFETPKPTPSEYIGLWQTSSEQSERRLFINAQLRALKTKGVNEDIVRLIWMQSQRFEEEFAGYTGINIDAILQVCIHECIEQFQHIRFKKDAFEKLLLW